MFLTDTIPLILDIFDDFDQPEYTVPRKRMRTTNGSRPYLRLVRPSSNNDKNKNRLEEKQQLTTPEVYHRSLNLVPFEPNEISLKVDGRTLTVHCKHEVNKGKDDENECLEYTKRMVIPDNVVLEEMKSRLDNDGILQLTAPIKPEETKKPEDEKIDNGDHIIPIQFSNNEKKTTEELKNVD